MQITSRGLLLAALLVFGLSQCRLYGQTMPQNFISVTPCRIADTRPSSGGAGPISGGTYRNFAIAGSCGIPSGAATFSVNVTAVPSGSSLLFLSVLPAPASAPTAPPTVSTLNDPLGTIVANAALVPAGSGGAVTIYVSDDSDVIIDVDGYFSNPINPATENTVVGNGAGNGAGIDNSAFGFNALHSSSNSGTSAAANSAFGADTLYSLTTGMGNTALGNEALYSNSSGLYNTAVGFDALTSNSSGDYNSALGTGALRNVTTGNFNIAIGNDAGKNLGSGSYNIDIGDAGSSSDTSVIRIGSLGGQTSTYIAGIYGVSITGSSVLINSNGQLGVQSSSIRYKEDVRDMADGSDALMQLRPVEFRYKQAGEDGSKPLQFGLVAEEVAKIYPELVVRGKDGSLDSVQYHQLPAMLLNEIQKQHRTIEELQADKTEQQAQIRQLQAEMEQMRALLVSK